MFNLKDLEMRVARLERSAGKPTIFDTAKYRDPASIVEAIAFRLLGTYHTGETIWIKDEGDLITRSRTNLNKEIIKNLEQRQKDYASIISRLERDLKQAERRGDTYQLEVTSSNLDETRQEHDELIVDVAKIKKGLTISREISRMSGIPGYRVYVF